LRSDIVGVGAVGQFLLAIHPFEDAQAQQLEQKTWLVCITEKRPRKGTPKVTFTPFLSVPESYSVGCQC
jgi:hypothetical protein